MNHKNGMFCFGCLYRGGWAEFGMVFYMVFLVVAFANKYDEDEIHFVVTM